MSVILIPINVFISMVVGSFWYSTNGFGSFWINWVYGSMEKFELKWKNTTPAIPMTITLITHIIFQLFLYLFITNVKLPTTLSDAIVITSIFSLIHVLYELPHVGFESRSYKAFLLHIGYHLVITFIPLCVYMKFFEF